MATPRYWGTIRKVLTSLSNQFISTNEDMEVLSQERARLGVLRGDFYPRGYTFPEMEVTIRCKATMKEGKVRLFGKNEEETDEVDITIRAPFVATPLTQHQLEVIIAMNEQEARDKLKKRGITKVGSEFFVPDEE